MLAYRIRLSVNLAVFQALQIGASWGQLSDLGILGTGT